MIVSVLDKVAGFYSILFFTINHYMACKKIILHSKLILPNGYSNRSMVGPTISGRLILQETLNMIQENMY